MKETSRYYPSKLLANDRREDMRNHLSRVREETIERLALGYGVSKKTIYRDLDILTPTMRFDITRGRYSVVKVDKDWSASQYYMDTDQTNLLIKIMNERSAEEAEMIKGVIYKFGARSVVKKCM